MLRKACPAALLLLSGCGGEPPAPPALATEIPPGAVAICAGKPIAPALVAAVAARRNLPPRGALELLADDARFATAAEQRGLDRSAAARSSRNASLARALLHEIRNDSAGEPTPAELARVRAEHWLLFDRPETVRVIHAVALAPGDDAAARARARTVAEAIAAAVRGATSDAEFKARAQAVAHEGTEVRIEQLDPVARDGRIASEEGGTFDPTFTQAAFRLERPAEQSPLVSTSFGVHVIQLVERLPAQRISDAELARTAREEILARRANAALKKLLEDLRRRDPVAIERSAEETLSVLDPPRSRP
jgi:hypothetical protein